MSELSTETTAPPEGPVAQCLLNAAAGLMTLLCVLWAVEAYRWLGTTFFGQQLLASVLGLSIFVAFLNLRARRGTTGPPPWYDWLQGVIGLLTLAYVAVDYERLSDIYGNRPTETLVIGIIVTCLVLEALRRATGYTLLSVVLVFIVYALLGDLVPGNMKALTVMWNELFTDFGIDAGAAYGTPLKIGAEVVIIFIFLGQLLLKTGGGDFYTDLAMAVMGRRRGGAAKVSVVASAMFGSISGSAVSNVASTGVITIPLMRQAGYSAVHAGAIEAVASTGGQFMPPIMGAAAFIMAEFLEIPYTDVVIAATVPALLYYFAIFVQVDLVAAKENITVVDSELPRARAVLAEGWHFIVPFAVLLIALFYFWTEAQEAAIYAAITIVAFGFFRAYKGKKMTMLGLVRSFLAAGLITVELVLILAGAGFVIFVLSTTGAGFTLALELVKLAGGAIFALLVIAAITCIILGMGMPTSGVYVLLAALVAPAISEAGVEPLAAHMFILYFGMMSMITPPVALCAFAAATLTRASAMTTAMQSMKLAWVAYIIPFLFVMSPTLLLNGDAGDILIDIMTACIGVYYISTAVVGFFARTLNGAFRMILVVSGLAAMLPAAASTFSIYLNAAGVVLGGLILGYEYMAGRRVNTGAAA